MATPVGAALVSTERFKLLDVTSRESIREFTTKHGLDFAAGKGFYELMKPELIQHYKEIVAVRRSDGSKVSGFKVRELLGIPASAAKFKLDTAKLSDFKVFVQSTSYNRVLVPGTQFLYEVGGGGHGSGSGGGSGGGSVEYTHDRPPPPPAGAGMPIEIVFSFDTTMMSSVLSIVRDRLQELIQRLQNDIPGIRIAVFAHGDYCDRSSTYITKHIDFTTDARKLCDFVKNVSSTGGGDFEECYELVLKKARELLSWTPGTQRALVMIGDAVPHEPADYGRCSILKKYPRVAWKHEVDAIVSGTGCRVYAVQCMDNPRSTYFWKYMAYHTHGYHLSLSNFNSVLDLIMAICYREQGPEQLQAYREEVEERQRASGGMNEELHRPFEALGVPAMSAASAPAASSAPTALAAPAASAATPAGSTPPSGAPSRKRKSVSAPPAKAVAVKKARAGAAAKPASGKPRGAARVGREAAASGGAASKKAARAASAAPKKKAAARKGPASAARGGKKALSGKGAAPVRAAATSAASRRGSAGASAAARGKKEAKATTPSRAAAAASRRPPRSPKRGPSPKKAAPRKPKRK